MGIKRKGIDYGLYLNGKHIFISWTHTATDTTGTSITKGGSRVAGSVRRTLTGLRMGRIAMGIGMSMLGRLD